MALLAQRARKEVTVAHARGGGFAQYGAGLLRGGDQIEVHFFWLWWWG